MKRERKLVESTTRNKVAEAAHRLKDIRLENLKLMTNIARMREEKEKSMDVLKERDEEIRKLIQPAEVPEFIQMMQDMENYLEDAEKRHMAHAAVLDEISVLINHNWSEE
jgi:hypothetical protein